MKIDVTPNMLRCQACNHILQSDELADLDKLDHFCLECYAASIDAAIEMMDDDLLDKFNKVN